MQPQLPLYQSDHLGASTACCSKISDKAYLIAYLTTRQDLTARLGPVLPRRFATAVLGWLVPASAGTGQFSRTYSLIVCGHIITIAYEKRSNREGIPRVRMKEKSRRYPRHCSREKGGRPVDGMKVKALWAKAASTTAICCVSIIIVAVLALTNTGQARAAGIPLRTGTVTGLVVTPDGQGVAGARVAVAGTALVTTTNARGEYCIEGVPAGWQTIEVTKEGMVAVNSLALTGDGRLTAPRAPGQPEAKPDAQPQPEGTPDAPFGTILAPSLDVLMARGSPEPMVSIDPFKAGNPGRPEADTLVGKVRVGVIADQVVRAPEVALATQVPDPDYISLSTLTPGPGQLDFQEGYSGTVIARVEYRLTSQATGAIKLFLVDDRGELLTTPGPEAQVTVAGGEGKVTVMQPFRVPKGTALVQPLVGLFPSEASQTFVWTLPPPYRVRIFAYSSSSHRVTNLVAHPEQATVYAAIDYPDQETDRLLAIPPDRKLTYSSVCVIGPDPGPMTISDDGSTLYAASRTGPVITIVQTDGLAAREVTVQHENIVGIAPLGPDLIAYVYKKQDNDRYTAAVLDIRSGKEYPWLDDLDYPSAVAGDSTHGIIYTVRTGYLEKWQYYYGQDDPMHLAKRSAWPLGNHDHILLDKANGVIFYAGYKLDSDDLRHIQAAIPGEPKEFIALSPDGKWVVDSNYTVYETEHLFPVVQLGRGDSPQPRAAFTSDGVVWLSEPSGLLAFRLPRQEAAQVGDR